jgi:hypothetical protein
MPIRIANNAINDRKVDFDMRMLRNLFSFNFELSSFTTKLTKSTKYNGDTQIRFLRVLRVLRGESYLVVEFDFHEFINNL